MKNIIRDIRDYLQTAIAYPALIFMAVVLAIVFLLKQEITDPFQFIDWMERTSSKIIAAHYWTIFFTGAILWLDLIYLINLFLF